MTVTSRDLIFIVASAIVAALAGFAVQADVLAQDGAVAPLLLIFLGMAAIEFAMGYIVQAPLGQFVTMPIRFAALAIAFGVYLLIVSV